MPSTLSLPVRAGSRPRTTTSNPHYQLDQHPPADIIRQLAERCFALPGVTEHASLIGPWGTRALWLDAARAQGPRAAFIIHPEFAHIHALPDGSLHLTLPDAAARQSYQQQWTEPHPMTDLAGDGLKIMLLYAPRTAEELAVAFGLIHLSYHFATGEGEPDNG